MNSLQYHGCLIRETVKVALFFSLLMIKMGFCHAVIRFLLFFFSEACIVGRYVVVSEINVFFVVYNCT